VKYAARGTWRLLSILVATQGGLGCGGAPDASETGGTASAISEGNTPESDGIPPALKNESPIGSVDRTVADAGCAVAAEGCPCDKDGETLDCPGSRIQTGNYVTCAPGKRTCVGGKWGPCVEKTVHEAPNSGPHPK
jgi:hypothetical protein